MMSLIENKITDFAMDYVDPPNRAEAITLINQALDMRADGMLTEMDVRRFIRKLLDLVKPAERIGLEKQFKKNEKLVLKFLVK